MIPYGKQDISTEDIKCVEAVLKSDFLTQGPVVPKFESKLAEISHSKYVTAFNSATSALHIACLALEVGPGDIVWTVPNTFVASANCALYCGAKIDFVDIDKKTSNLSIQCLTNKLKKAKDCNMLPKVVIPVHLTGEPCNMRLIHNLSKKYGFKIIEDASHAIGGLYDKEPVGSSKYSDITVFSFHPVKIITSGEGGAALTNNKNLDQKMKLLRSHGITRDQTLMEHPNTNAWYYEQIDLGFNYRMTDIHAALGLSQLDRIQDFITKRHDIANYYDKKFKETNINTPYRNPENLSSLHLYVIQVEKSKHEAIFRKLREEGVGVNLHYIPVHTHPYYIKLGFNWGDFPNSEAYYKKAISLPIYPTLEKYQQDFVIDKVKLIINE
ncbi:UDP-4-amino-4,6-dideoxy-N-acetyl-beta-L-altrosamine transaminase [Gammaproteobacteria bacterium]|nr:UDP-4-amino-4,6-dideoxy-N-acetyl-beta-L-altrosamine transaminase [Gammaproteobacteria bacterium]